MGLQGLLLEKKYVSDLMELILLKSKVSVTKKNMMQSKPEKWSKIFLKMQKR